MSAYNAVHLNTVTESDLNLHYSAYHQRRARQIHSFLNELHTAANLSLKKDTKLELLVLSKQDWSMLNSSVYGVAYSRTKKLSVELIVPADYPARLLHQLDSVFLAASFRLPSEITELLNLMLGFEWAAAYLKQLGLLPSTAKQNLLRITQLYLLSLESAGWSLKERLDVWFFSQEKLALFEEALDSGHLKLALQAPKSQRSLSQKYLAYAWAFSELSSSSSSWDDLAII